MLQVLLSKDVQVLFANNYILKELSDLKLEVAGKFATCNLAYVTETICSVQAEIHIDKTNKYFIPFITVEFHQWIWI